MQPDNEQIGELATASFRPDTTIMVDTPDGPRPLFLYVTEGDTVSYFLPNENGEKTLVDTYPLVQPHPSEPDE